MSITAMRRHALLVAVFLSGISRRRWIPRGPIQSCFQNGSGILPYGGDLVPQISGAPAGNLFDTFPVPSHRMGGEEECLWRTISSSPAR